MSLSFKLELVSLLLVLVVVFVSAQQPFCKDFTDSGTGPSLPPLPNVYETRIEVIYQGAENKSETVRHYFDYQRRQAAILIQSKNLNHKLIFDYETDEIHVVESQAVIPPNPSGDMPPSDPYSCKTYSLSNSPNMNWHFGVYQKNQTYFVPGTIYEALRFQNYSQAYQGIEMVRGIACDTWLSCQYIPQLKANFTAKYYFSNGTQKMPNSNYTRIPVRADFNGVRIRDDGTSEPFTEIYHFYDFVAGRVNPHQFVTPSGVTCENRKISRPIPNIENGYKRYIISEEIVSGTTLSHIKNFYYDEKYQAVRAEYRNTKRDELTFNTLDPLRIIHDYNVGVSIGINMLNGNCSFLPISNRSFEEDANYTSGADQGEGGSFIIRLKNGKQLLLLDADYVYTGRRFTNDIPVHTFISEQQIGSQFTIVEYAFSADNIQTGIFNEFEKNIPVSMSLKSPNLFEPFASNYYSYAPDLTYLQAFDIAECYINSEKIPFIMSFDSKGKIPQEATVVKEYLVEMAYDSLMTAANESFTRFTRPRVFVTDDMVYIYSSILPHPPPIHLFTKIPGKWLVGTGIAGIKYNCKSPEICAEFCLEKGGLSFDWSFSTSTCYANKKHGSEATLSSFGNYSHWSRSTLNNFGSKPDYIVYTQLESSIKQGLAKLTVPYKTIELGSLTDDYVILTASSIKVYDGQRMDFETNIALSKYNLKYEERKYDSKRYKTVPNQRVEDCAQLCTDELAFECKSFHFCFINGECKMSDTLAAQAEDISVDHCNIYEQNQLFHYRAYPGTVSVNKKDKMYKVESAGECASKCDKETSIHCRSFDYCAHEQACYVSDRHLPDSIDTPDLVCKHYSRDYLSDFSFVSTSVQVLDAELVYSDTKNIDGCATLCVAADGFNCHSFDYCPETKTCMLNSGYKPMTSLTNQTAGVVVDTCSNYKREYFYLTSLAQNSKGSDHSETILTALSVVFAIVSLVFGTVGTHFLIKKKLTA